MPKLVNLLTGLPRPACLYHWQCTHYDLSLLKQAYDARHAGLQKGSVARQAQASGHLPASTALLASNAAEQQSSTLWPGYIQRDIDLRGVSANPANNPFHGLAPTHDAADQDILSQLQPSSANTTSLAGRLQPSSAFPSQVYTPVLSTRRSLMFDWGAIPVPFTRSPTHPSRYLPIGRQVCAILDSWECQWANRCNGTESLSSLSEDGPLCLLACSSVSQLSEHYRSAHGLFHEEDPPFMWKCRSCQFLNNCEGLCPQCQRPQSGWEKWYYGYVTVTGLSVSLPATSVRASDPASSFATSLSSTFSSHGYSNSGCTSFTTGCYSPGSGTGGSFIQRCLVAPPNMLGRQLLPNSWLYITSLALVLALASCLQAYVSVFVCAGAVAGWADEVATSIQVGSWWNWKNGHIRTVVSGAVFLLTIFLALRVLGQFRRSFGRSERNNTNHLVRHVVSILPGRS